MIDQPDVRITGDERDVLNVEASLGASLLTALAYAARRHDVMISLTVSPYDHDEDGNPGDASS